MAEVERRRWFVEQQHRGILRERPSQQHPLTLTTRERFDQAVGETSQLEAAQRGIDCVVIAIRFDAEQRNVRSATEGDVLDDGRTDGHQRRLDHHRHQLGPFRGAD